MTAYYTSDRSAIQIARNREAARQYRAQFEGPSNLQRLLTAYVDAYPDADPKVLFSLAMSGQEPSDPAVQAAMEASFDNDRSKGLFDRVGDILSPVGDVAGKVLNPIGRGLDALHGPIDELLAAPTRAAVRTGFVVVESGLQELQNFTRAGIYTATKGGGPAGFVNALQRSGTSTGREMFEDIFAGEHVDLGHGWLPGGNIAAEVKREANQLEATIGGVRFGGPGNPSITLGRTVAAQVSEPGESAFNLISGLVDAGVAWYADPAALVGSFAKTTEAGVRAGRAANVARDVARGEATVADIGRAAKTDPSFARLRDRSAQGRLIENVTGRIDGVRKTVLPDVAAEWLSKGGRRVVERIAETGDIYDLWHATGKQIPMRLLVPLAEAADPQTVYKILEPELGVGLREAPEFLGFKVRRANKQTVRILGDMPGSHIDPADIDDAVETMDRVLATAKASVDLRRKAVNNLARNPSRETMVATVSEIMGDLADELAGTVKGGTPRARQLTRLWEKDRDFVTAYFIDEIAENRQALGVKVGDSAVRVQSPFLYSEYLNGLIPLPDAREIRRATSVLRKFVDTPFFERAVTTLDKGQNAWKRLTLLRGAYTARVIGEEQIRMAASGMDSMFAHPLSFIAGLVGDDGRFSKHIPNAGRRGTDVLGQSFYDDLGNPVTELKQALNTKQFGGWVDQKRLVSDEWKVFTPEDGDAYYKAWADGIGELWFDDVAREVAKADGTLDDVKAWFWDSKFRREMAESHPDLDTLAGASQYIDTLWEGIQYRAAGDPVLMDAIRTGMIGDAKIGGFDVQGRWRNSPELEAHLLDSVGPQAVKGRRADVLLDRVGFFDNATSWAFSYLSTKPTNWLSRSQTFKQRYWQRIGEMVPFMDDTARAAAIDAARAAGVPSDVVRSMERAKPNATRPLDDLRDADEVAKSWALDETKDLLYDLTDRSQFFDVFRLIFPFGEAWKEVLGRWAKIGVENPRVFRRGQQVITGARGAGFFHKDTNGEEVFTYPFSRQLSRLAIGVPVDLTGRVSGLSLMTEVLPGVGPVVQVPAAALLPETPDWDFAREFVFPFGETDYSKGFLESFAPSYLRNVMQFFERGDPRLFANTTMQIADYLASTGDYDLSVPEEQARMLDDAKGYAKGLYAFRGMAQFISPTSPLPETLIKGPKGDELLVRRAVVDDLHRLQEEHGYDEGTAEFIERYGVDFLRFTEGMTTSISRFLPVSKESAEWERANAGVVKDYSLVWGLFAPAGEELDMAAYSRQLERGDRKPLTPQQRLLLANAAVGQHLYKQAQAKVGDKPSKAGREWLALVKEKIREEYPGFGEIVPGLPARASTDQVVAELTRAVADPRVANTRQARAARLYLQARTRALAYASEVGVKSLEAEAARPAREWLGLVARRLVAEYPEWSEFFDAVFSREVET